MKTSCSGHIGFRLLIVLISYVISRFSALIEFHIRDRGEERKLLVVRIWRSKAPIYYYIIFLFTITNPKIEKEDKPKINLSLLQTKASSRDLLLSSASAGMHRKLHRCNRDD
ncbi:hypothetical protein M9H77_04163 [Catharanthus roseus]|uniref:Uncharacterized protein n=1 Tax=Catharanthus roseus TaxID=4058 RepID=A0ACC0CDH9_CATRO|nr:hypothetical protein M9H77_04163 [Catharanthus roseus]